MRKALWALLAVALVACTSQGPTPTVVGSRQTNEIRDDVKKVMALRDFPQAATFNLTEPVNLSEPLHRFAGGPDIGGQMWPNMWEWYMVPAGAYYSDVARHPRLIEVMAAEKRDEVPCGAVALGWDQRKPLVCPEAERSERTPQDYVMVLPASFSQTLVEITSKFGAQMGWKVASLTVALLYADYLRMAYQPTLGWPEDTAMQHCVAGMSLRMVYPSGQLTVQDLQGAAAFTDPLFSLPADEYGGRAVALWRGFTIGNLAGCA